MSADRAELAELPRDVGSARPASVALALYSYETCPFCRHVIDAIHRLGADVELRDILTVERHREELIAARGRATVPVLRISSADGSERWMPESSEIIAWLEESYG